MIADNWDIIEEELRHATDWVRCSGLDQLQSGDQPIRTKINWDIEFQDRVFRPGKAINRDVDLSEYEIPVSSILSELRDAGLLPSYYRFTLSLDDSAIGMEYYVRGLIEAGASATETLDYYMLEFEDLTPTAWADERGVDQSKVSRNVTKAKNELK